MNCISVEIGTFDLYFSDLADNVVEQQAEQDLLEALAAELVRSAKASGGADTTDGKFLTDAADRCAQLAKWFKENQP
jgi:hypothetical protein